MNNQQIFETAKNRSAIDLNCHKDILTALPRLRAMQLEADSDRLG